MDFPYFADPVNFTYLLGDDTPCHFCGSTDYRLNGDNLYGIEIIGSICFRCLRNGALIDLEIMTNDVNLRLLKRHFGDDDRAKHLANEILYRTPPLPTWQDHPWPFVDGDFCKFIKIASKADFTKGTGADTAKDHFISSLAKDYRHVNDPEWLWSMLPDDSVTSLQDGNFDMSVYLFSSNGRPLCTWDGS